MIKLDNYDIRQDGSIYSKKTKKHLAYREDNDGYRYVEVYNGEGKKMMTGLHRVIALKYIPNPQNKPQINHKDKNPRNNHVDNLEWVTAAENQLHRYRTI